MKVNEMTNLWIGYNKDENFRILICAEDEVEAKELAEAYGADSDFKGNFKIFEFDDVDTHFDCDYIIAAHDA